MRVLNNLLSLHSLKNYAVHCHLSIVTNLRYSSNALLRGLGIKEHIAWELLIGIHFRAISAH